MSKVKEAIENFLDFCVEKWWIIALFFIVTIGGNLLIAKEKATREDDVTNKTIFIVNQDEDNVRVYNPAYQYVTFDQKMNDDGTCSITIYYKLKDSTDER